MFMFLLNSLGTLPMRAGHDVFNLDFGTVFEQRLVHFIGNKTALAKKLYLTFSTMLLRGVSVLIRIYLFIYLLLIKNWSLLIVFLFFLDTKSDRPTI